MSNPSKPAIIPMLYLGHGEGVAAVEFYKAAFGATEIRRFSNDDGTVHVSELEIAGSMFRMHEEKPAAGQFSANTAKGVTTDISLMVSDPDALMVRAVAAGATETSPMQDYDYGYRQGSFTDPFGHHWTVEKVI